MRRPLPYIIVLLLLLTACFNLNKLSLFNLSGLYNAAAFTRLDAAAFNEGGNKVRIYARVKLQDFSIIEDESSGKSYSEARLTYKMFRDYESKSIMDSASFLITDTSLRISDTIVSFVLEYPGEGEYILSLELDDMNSADAVKSFVHLESAEGSANEFLLLDEDGIPAFKNILDEGEKVKLRVAGSPEGRLWVKFYERDFPLATPPFLEDEEFAFDYRPDSIFSLQYSLGMTPEIAFADPGFYFLQVDSSSRRGFTIYRYYEGFPKVMTSGQMLEPLRYITNRTEYDALRSSTDRKLAVDDFWLSNAGNPMRARAMIQKFYGRVEEANMYFSSYHEGWKSDRGLIYIIYGPPQRVFRGRQIEEWLYGEKGNPNSIRFMFVKMENPFSENDYSLVTSPAYREKWYNIVNTWRR